MAVVPTDWRLAIIRPMHKNGDSEDVSNYRPVSRNSVICKIFERIMKRALLSFFSDTRPISPHPHGFLPRPSCPFNLLVFEKKVIRMMDEGHTVEAIYLDFARAFDSINHRFLLAKMKSFGFGDVDVR